MILEVGAVRLACEKRTDADIAHMKEILDLMEAELDRGCNVVDTSMEFHMALMRATKNKILCSFMMLFRDLLLESRSISLSRPERPREALGEHKAILQAVVDRDSALAASVMEIHIKKHFVRSGRGGDVTLKEQALEMHRTHRGKIEVVSKAPLLDKHDLSIAYTPGVAEPCKEIHADPDKVYEYTCKGNMVAVVTNGTAVLGLGDIGPAAGMPVMEGKAVLFKTFAGVDAFPICLDSKNPDEIVSVVRCLEPTLEA